MLLLFCNIPAFNMPSDMEKLHHLWPMKFRVPLCMILQYCVNCPSADRPSAGSVIDALITDMAHMAEWACKECASTDIEFKDTISYIL